MMGKKKTDAAKQVQQSKIREIYKVIYPDVQSFLASRKQIFEDDETNVKDSFNISAKPSGFGQQSTTYTKEQER